MTEPLLEARGIVKRFGHVRALQGADFAASAGEVIALIGDNGAGKSTLVKVLSGTLQPDGGEIRFEGRRVTLPSPVAARSLGIETVYQDLALAPDLAANLFLGREQVRGGVLGWFGLLDNKAMRRQTDESFRSLGIGVQTTTAAVKSLSGGQRQSVAVSRAVTWANKVLFLDEPTAALGVVATGKVLDLIRRVRDQGLAVVLVSHNMPEVLQVSDRIEVLRLGRRVATFKASEASMEDLVGAMTGAISQAAPPAGSSGQAVDSRSDQEVG
jgi:simple sugar transport system ATP-binding protein